MKRGSLRLITVLITSVAALAMSRVAVSAFELSHYAPGLANADDFFLPPPELGQFIYAQYNMYYTTDTFRNSNGDKADSVTVTGPRGRPFTLDLDINVDQFFLAPALLWAPRFTLLGARYGAYAIVPIGNPNIQASLDTRIGPGRSIDESAWGIGDCYFQPLWLMWSIERLDAFAAYGFTAPTGRYEDGSATNVGLGFFEHQVQSGVRYHFDEAKTLSLVFVPTFDIPQDKIDVDITPGAQFSLNWALRKNFAGNWFQLALIGYDTFQLTDDSGAAATDSTLDQVHAAGVQVGVPKFGLSIKYMHEYLAQSRFEGQLVTLAFGLPLDLVFDKVAEAFR